MQDLITSIRAGKIFDDIETGIPITELKEKLGTPSEVTGNSDVGYIFFDKIRIGYLRHAVDTIAILFDEESQPFNIHVPLLNDETIQVSGKTKINEFIQILNYSQIHWRSDNEEDLDYFFIKTRSEVTIIFDLATGNLVRIAYPRNLIC